MRTRLAIGAVIGAGALAAAVAVPGTASAAGPGAATPFAAAASHTYNWSSVHAVQAAARQWTVVADHLNNPRQITYAHGNVYDAEAGASGDTCLGPGMCGGLTGGVIRVHNGVALPVLGGLVSVGAKNGTFATGSDGVAVGSDGSLNVIETSIQLPNPPGLPAEFARQLGHLLRYDITGLHPVANIAKYEYAHDPDGQGEDSDPYSVVSLGANRFAVADAAGNDVLEVAADGSVSLLAVLPNNSVGAQAVPTSLAVGPDGGIYVGELGGGEHGGTPAGGSRVWRIDRHTHALSEVATGFTNITGLGFGPDGSMYVTELTRDATFQSPFGDVVRVAPNGTRTRMGTKLVFPAGVAVDASGNVFVNNGSVFPANTPMSPPFFGMRGQLVELTAPAA